MRIDQRLVDVEEHDTVPRSDDSVCDFSRVRIHDFREDVTLSDSGIDIGVTDKDACCGGFDIHQRVSFDKLRNKAFVTSVIDDPLFAEKAEHRVDRFSCADGFDAVGRAGVDGKRLRFPRLLQKWGAAIDIAASGCYYA